MSATFAQLLTRLQTRLRDTQDTVWTNAEKTDILTTAINDPFVYIVNVDTSLTTAPTTRSYALPAGYEAFFEIGIDLAGDGFPTILDRSAFDVINGRLYISSDYKSLPAGKTLHLIGKQKLTTGDTLPDFLVDYVLEFAMVESFEMLKTSLTARFLKNDMTMGEIIASINTHRAEMQRLQKRIANQRLVRL